MTQIASAQQLEAAAGRVAAKLEGFYGSLPDDEQLVLDISLPRLLAGEAELDVSGYAPKRGVVALAARAIVWYFSNATPVWSDDFEFPYTGVGPDGRGNPPVSGGSNGTHVQ
jgi:hypothetical protein